MVIKTLTMLMKMVMRRIKQDNDGDGDQQAGGVQDVPVRGTHH